MEKAKHGYRNMSNLCLVEEELLQVEYIFNATLQVLPMHWATTDIFLFNIGKAKKAETEVNYGFIEDFKDENVFACKYYSKELIIKVPKFVMVFSNNAPDVK